MLKNESSFFKNKAPAITNDEQSLLERSRPQIHVLDLGFLTKTRKKGMGTGKPGNGKNELRRKTEPK